MKASVGDSIVIASAQLDGPIRDGRIVEVRGADGGPPYLVEWAHTGQRGLVFPGPDAHVRSHVQDPAGGRGDEPTVTRHVRSWRVEVDLFEAADQTSAHAVLTAESPKRLDARGTAQRRPGDPDVPEIGDEIAVARALRLLSDRLLAVAAEDTAAIEGHPVSLPG
jgi:Domain of unknown function (DUF1876)/Domain of unknown function (DUF1918)